MEVRRASVLCLAVTIVATGALAGREAGAADPFTLVDDTIDVGEQAHGIAFDGAEWHIAAIFSNSWRDFDTDFGLLGTTIAAGAAGANFRGLAFDEASGNLFAGNFRIVEVFEVTVAGEVVSSFRSNVPQDMNAIAIDPFNGTLWLVSFDGLVHHVTRSGVLLGSFETPGLQWTGATFDAARNTLLLLETNRDAVHEYDPLGTPLGLAIATDAVRGNGQGLHYDSATGILHVTSQFGPLAIWSRNPGGPTLRLEPQTGFDLPGTEHTLTATLLGGVDPIPDVEVAFEVFAGPNAGSGGSDTTDGGGEATFAYTSDGRKGVDQIEASFVDDGGGTIPSHEVLEFWDDDCQRPPNAIPDTCDIDCNAFDGFCGEFAGCGGSTDLDGDGVPDECNQDPVCDGAVPDRDLLWLPNHGFEDVSVLGVIDPDGDPITVTIAGITQDEAVNEVGDGSTCPDGDGVGTDVAGVRAERGGPGDGRVYRIRFSADDGRGGECSGAVSVCVPHDRGPGATCVDGGLIFDSTVCGGDPAAAVSAPSAGEGCGIGFELAFLLPGLMSLRRRVSIRRG